MSLSGCRPIEENPSDREGLFLFHSYTLPQTGGRSYVKVEVEYRSDARGTFGLDFDAMGSMKTAIHLHAQSARAVGWSHQLADCDLSPQRRGFREIAEQWSGFSGVGAPAGREPRSSDGQMRDRRHVLGETCAANSVSGSTSTLFPKRQPSRLHRNQIMQCGGRAVTTDAILVRVGF